MSLECARLPLVGEFPLCGAKPIERQTRSRKEGVYATVFSAVTPVSRALGFRDLWQRIMSPLSANAIESS